MKAIKIVYDINARIEFLFLAEFFRLCGVYVGEFVFDEGCGDLSNNENPEDDFDIELFVKRDNSKFGAKCIIKSDWDRESEIPLHILPKDKNIENEMKKQKDGLNAILDVMEIAENDLRVFKAIAEVYVENGLMWHCANLQYYRICADIHEESIKIFDKAKEELAENGLVQDNRHIWYARLYCASKANSACYYSNYSFLYDIDDLARECHQLIEKSADFSNAWVLLGLIYEHTRGNGNAAVVAFQKALNTEKTKSYASHIYYFMGKRYEAYDREQDIARECYFIAYKRKKRYRNIYKLAIMENKEDHFDEALKWLEEIIVCLKPKKDRGYLDPLEVEYYYKSNSLASYICCVKKECYERAIEYAKKALEIADNLGDQQYYNDFYGEKAELYRSLSKSRMNLNKICQYLAVSNRELGKYDEVERWWDRAKKEKQDYKKITCME